VVPCDSRRENVMYIHEAAVQAESIFRSICPTLDMFADREDMLQSTEMARHTADEDAELAGLDAILSSVGFPTAKEHVETADTGIDEHKVAGGEGGAILLGAVVESSSGVVTTGLEVVELVEETSSGNN
jgi:hypothetical protein